jgi:hypothetical protein
MAVAGSQEEILHEYVHKCGQKAHGAQQLAVESGGWAWCGASRFVCEDSFSNLADNKF